MMKSPLNSKAMSQTVIINRIAVETECLASFAFAFHTSNPAHPQYEDLALLRVDPYDGAPMIVKGAEAVTLKVLLASLGLRDLSASWDVVPDPRTIQPSPLHESASASSADFPPDG